RKRASGSISATVPSISISSSLAIGKSSGSVGWTHNAGVSPDRERGGNGPGQIRLAPLLCVLRCRSVGTAKSRSRDDRHGVHWIRCRIAPACDAARVPSCQHPIIAERGAACVMLARDDRTRMEARMASEGYHEPIDELSDETRDMHRAIISLMEELEAVDWYNQRVDACKDPELRAILEHNRD